MNLMTMDSIKKILPSTIRIPATQMANVMIRYQDKGINLDNLSQFNQHNRCINNKLPIVHHHQGKHKKLLTSLICSKKKINCMKFKS